MYKRDETEKFDFAREAPYILNKYHLLPVADLRGV